MDQQELRKLENQCIQEQPPWCTAACPLHVDARGFILHVSEGKWDEARKVLRRTMPFPGILGRICDAPCRESCKRSEAGDPIEINALERFCVSLPAPRQRIQPLPAKEKTVAVIGTGLSGLTAAWDLGRKGYRVDIFETEKFPGGYLHEKYPEILTGEIISSELASLEKLGVNIHLKERINDPSFIERCKSEFDAVFLSLEIVDPNTWDMTVNSEGRVEITPTLQKTNLEKVFAGGQIQSPVFQAAEGRWAASSIDRFLQNVSMTAGREKEGLYETRLYTSLEGIESLPAVAVSSPEGIYTADEARAEARRCLQCQCLECVKVCPYLESFKAYPKKYSREIYNNESIVMGARQANTLINSCSLCGLCEVVCPEDFAMQDLCLQARRNMVLKNKMPPSAHEFALLDMEFSQSERFFTARPDPAKQECDFLFFPGCQLAAVRPQQTAMTYDYLRTELEGGVGLILGCCGAPAHWSGREELFLEVLERFRGNWKMLGRPQIIAACSTCLMMIKNNLPDINVVSIWQVFSNIKLPETKYIPQTPLAVHDPCTSRDEREVQYAARVVLAKAGAPFEELELGREKTECCGFGGLMQSANPDLAREVIKRRAEQSEAGFLTYCAMCRDSLAAVGKRVIHLLDLFFPIDIAGDPEELPRIGWSERQENRTRLKSRLLRDIWGEDFELMEEHQKIRLIMAPEVKELLNKRRILDEDLQKVVYNAEKTGSRLFNSETGRYKASFKPYKAVFWVEYTPVDNGFEIHNAYAHRMEVVGGVRK